MNLEQYKQIGLNRFKEYCYDVTMYDQLEAYFVKMVMQSINPELFVDVGFNWGGVSDIILNVSPETKIIGYEPDKRNYRISVNSFKNKVELYPYAVAKWNGFKRLYYCKDTTQTGLKYNLINKYWWVKTIKLDNLFNKIKDNKKIIFKIDTEGTEPDIIYGMKKIFKKYKNSIGIIFEYSFKWLYSEKELQKLLNYFFRYGFSLFRLNAFGIESLGYNGIFELKQYHYSLLFAVRNITFRENIEMLTTKYGTKEFMPILRTTDIKIQDFEDKI